MILPFQKQFVEPILDGTKLHTIREDAPGRWKAGNKIHAATGVRTPQYHCFFESKCVSTQTIKIKHYPGQIEVRIGGYFFGEAFHHGLNDIYELSISLKELAKNDGFDDSKSFFQWFHSDYKGKIIHWTDLRY